MKTSITSIALAALLVATAQQGFSQLTVQKKDGGSVMTKLTMGIKVNDGSSLMREHITINDPSCPIELLDVGIDAIYVSPGYAFKPVGSLNPKEPIVAYEVIHMLYDVFGKHMKSLSNSRITDISGPTEFNKYSSWRASESNVSSYLVCVSYVSSVRTLSGKLWSYNVNELKGKLNQLELEFEEYDTKKDDD